MVQQNSSAPVAKWLTWRRSRRRSSPQPPLQPSQSYDKSKFPKTTSRPGGCGRGDDTADVVFAKGIDVTGDCHASGADCVPTTMHACTPRYGACWTPKCESNACIQIVSRASEETTGDRNDFRDNVAKKRPGVVYFVVFARLSRRQPCTLSRSYQDDACSIFTGVLRPAVLSQLLRYTREPFYRHAHLSLVPTSASFVALYRSAS
ncbi:hypothetical protein MRX96_043387 [Rhipicephalus microplus]